MRSLLFFMLCMVLLVAGCSHHPYHETNLHYKRQAKELSKQLRQKPGLFAATNKVPTQWVGTTNFNLRKPNYVIIHHTAQNSCEQTLKTFTLVRTQVSAHYVICKDGMVHHMLNDYLRAWHGGSARWGSLTDINSSSIGIEIDNNGFETFTEPQINSLLVLLDTLKFKYAIPVNNFIGHADIAPTRKNDPNVTFPWRMLSERGFGLWYSDTTNLFVPENFNAILGLKIVGYDVRDSSAAKLAFKRHFLQDTTRSWNEADQKILYDIMRKSIL
ncbi:N-acetylmuramoyl-L-alanine amidase [Segetibacter sp. 3557_3]|uniref:N-acetylmuramoyl-L-alanine amidase n=1 Tax=Segetibacter sp. 3557_3 TaxID=2547429 RepID=UPI0010589635|nr:N-acetylmuramoyl-L-alanine amidase [Segetibacter sp. 3557_3]TDH25181.1 N-acetylmuramoyl-L-alanine amidase [Segetibacter sp. 3557_3]